jgi:hypothetical protein
MRLLTFPGWAAGTVALSRPFLDVWTTLPTNSLLSIGGPSLGLGSLLRSRFGFSICSTLCILSRGPIVRWVGTCVGGPRRCSAGASLRIGPSSRPSTTPTTFRACWPASSLTTLRCSSGRSRFIAAGGLDPRDLRCGRVSTTTTGWVVIFRTGSGCPSSSSTMSGAIAAATWLARVLWISIRYEGSGSPRSVFAAAGSGRKVSLRRPGALFSGRAGPATGTRRGIIVTLVTDHASPRFFRMDR